MNGFIEIQKHDKKNCRVLYAFSHFNQMSFHLSLKIYLSRFSSQLMRIYDILKRILLFLFLSLETMFSWFFFVCFV
jgi:hypothetical protein